MKLLLTLLLAGLCVKGYAQHESVTYTVSAYNADAAAFTLQAFGQKPEGAYAIFDNPYGATRGNRYNQIPRGCAATLWLSGWEGCTVERVTLRMCSNNKSGTLALEVTCGDQTLFTMPTCDFADAAWYGEWVSKDLGIYAEVSKPMQTLAPLSADDLAITVRGGHPEGSVYLHSITIDYTTGGTPTESAMGWQYTKLDKKSILSDGDVVMLYRSGDAAGDIDGMATSHYLDAIGLGSTACVTEPFVTTFTLAATDAGAWTLTNQHGRCLGATGKQALAWDEGVMTWRIAIGYEGAEITSTADKYGTLRYNAPAESYARFWNYTSTSLPLPYLYRRTQPCSPVAAQRLTLSREAIETTLSTDTLLLKAALQPAATTDTRIAWASSDTQVATVRDGIVHLVGVGTAIITATTYDGSLTATCRITVAEPPSDGLRPIAAQAASPEGYAADGRRWRAAPLPSISITGRKKVLQ